MEISKGGPIRALSAVFLLLGPALTVSAQIVESVNGARGAAGSAAVVPLSPAAVLSPALVSPSVLVPGSAVPSAIAPAAAPLAPSAQASAPGLAVAAPLAIAAPSVAAASHPIAARGNSVAAPISSVPSATGISGAPHAAGAALRGLESRIQSERLTQGAALDGFYSSSEESPRSGESSAQAPSAPEESSRGMSRAKRIEYLTALAKDHPTHALAHIKTVLDDPEELHMEILISALRLLEPMPSSETAAFLIHLIADSKHYYLRREAIRMVLANSASLSNGRKDEALAALRQAAEAPDAPVRIAARGALERLGVDPGPEIIPVTVKIEPEIVLSPEEIQAKAEQDAKDRAEAEAAARPWWKKAADNIKANKGLYAAGAAALALGAVIFHLYRGTGLGLLMLVASVPAFSWLYHRHMQTARQPEITSIRSPVEAGKGKGSADFQPDFTRPTTRFAEVAGIDEAMTEINELKDFLQHPENFNYMGAQMPKGVLLVGPPGTGKTLLARALAGESGVPFYNQAGSDFVEQYVGVGASRVRVLFDKAEKNAPAIVFIDEIDAIGGSRDDQDNSEWLGTLTAMLTKMDGFNPARGVLLIGATNRLDSLDPALRRRFARIIYVGKPDVMGREAILQVHARTRRIGADVDLHKVARNTAGLSGSYLATVVNEAALLAARGNKGLALDKMRPISQADFDEAIEKVTVGMASHLIMSAAEKKRLARHEAGHQLLRLLLHGKASTVTIVPRSNDGTTLGYSRREGEEEDRIGYTSEELQEELIIAFGGLVAEEQAYKNFSTGVVGDLEMATKIASDMVLDLGMGRQMRFGIPVRNKPQELARMSEDTKRKVDADIAEIKENAYRRAEALLSDPANAAALDRLEKALLESETISGDKSAAIAGVQKIAR